MENWNLDKIVRVGRISMWVFIISFFAPSPNKILTAFQGNLTVDETKLIYLFCLELIIFVSLIIFGVLALICAVEAGGRTRSNRITIGELNREFSQEEIKKAGKLYTRNPLIFPYHHILMVPMWIVEVNLRFGWLGLPKHLLVLETKKNQL